jgi:dienelactone hydrolase
MRFAPFTLAPLAVAALTLSAPLRAQSPSPVTFVYLRGAADTLGTEIITASGARMKGVLQMRGQPRIEWEHQQTSMTLGALHLRVMAPPPSTDTAALQEATFTVRRDSLLVDINTNGKTQRQAVQVPVPDLVPLINASVLHASFIAAYGERRKLETIPIVLTTGAQSGNARLQMQGDTSVLTLGSVAMRILRAPDGLPSEIRIPVQGSRVVRASGAVKVSSRLDYSAPANAPYTAEAVTIPTGKGFTLAGTLTRPRGVSRMPVVVTISGSGPQERDSRLLPEYALFREIADTLGRRGVAVLRYDDRGVGESTGRESAMRATSADFADDVRAVIAYLRTRPDVDPDRIMLAGHSEGGFIAPMVAATDAKLRGIALLAGPAYTGRRVMLEQNKRAVEAAPIAPQTRDSILRSVPSQLDALGRDNPWMAFFMRHDPLVTARQVKQPVLILQGATDTQVTPEQADTLAAALKAAGNARVTMRVYPETNHLFLKDADGDSQGYTKLASYRVRRDVLGLLADWAVQTLR